MARPVAAVAQPDWLPLKTCLENTTVVDVELARAFVAELGGDLETLTLEGFLGVRTADMEVALGTTRLNGGAITPIQRGALMTAIRALATVGGMAPPALGGMLSQSLPSAPSHGGYTTANVTKRKIMDVLDDTEGEFVVMQDGPIRALRAAFETANAGVPRESEDVTADQISALGHRLAGDSAPFVDFARWGPYGRRQAKMMRYTAQIWVGGELVTQRLDGPANFEAWRAGWRVFRTGMLMLKGSLAGPMDEYEEGIRMMAFTFPDHWGTIAVADDLMRSEPWEKLRQRIEKMLSRGLYTEPWDPDRPWESVIRESANGTSRMADSWWFEHVKQSCLRECGRPTLTVAGTAWMGNTSGEREEALRQKRGLAGMAQRKDGRYVRTASGQELCFAWNRCTTGCDEQCEDERAHSCEWCLDEGHRAIDDACTAPKRPQGWKPSR